MAADAESNELSDWIPEAVELGISLQGGRCARTGEGEGRQRTDLSRQRLPLFSPCPPPHISGAWRPVALPRSCALCKSSIRIAPHTSSSSASTVPDEETTNASSSTVSIQAAIYLDHHGTSPSSAMGYITHHHPQFPSVKTSSRRSFFSESTAVAATSPAIHVWRQVQQDHEPGWRDVPIQNHVDKDAANHAANLLKSFMQRQRLLKTLQNLTPS